MAVKYFSIQLNICSQWFNNGGNYIAHSTNIANKYEESNQYIEAHKHRYGFCEVYETIYKEKYGFDIRTTGSVMQDQLKYGIETNCITGYSKLMNVDQIKHSLSNKRPVYSGTSKIDWTQTRAGEDNVAVAWNGYGHIFVIVGYDDDKKLLKCMNSYGIKPYDKWFFYFRYSDFNLLFSSYSLADKEDEQSIKSARERIELKKKEVIEKVLNGLKLNVREQIFKRNRGI